MDFDYTKAKLGKIQPSFLYFCVSHPAFCSRKTLLCSEKILLCSEKPLLCSEKLLLCSKQDSIVLSQDSILTLENSIVLWEHAIVACPNTKTGKKKIKQPKMKKGKNKAGKRNTYLKQSRALFLVWYFLIQYFYGFCHNLWPRKFWGVPLGRQFSYKPPGAF